MKYLFTRKHNKEDYKFYLMTYVSWITNKPVYKIVVHSPVNCFGYYDSIMVDSNGIASGSDRYHPPYILKRLAKQILAATSKYANENTYFMEGEVE